MTEAERRRLFNELYAEYDRRIFAYCLYVIGDRDKANDVFQEVFIKVYKSLHTIREEGKSSNWLFRIARNECLNALKATQRNDKRNTSYDESDTSYIPALDGTGYNDEITHLHWGLQQLSNEQREALVLAEFEGYSLKEIAEVTGASLSNVKVRIFRAKQKLYNLLQPILNDYE
ncbi:MAG: RNA polymerase sigma factor [Ignavibacteria bacterium]|nr:RNA polymerase sigma factor [Ignavibacteria bacterium]